ncbi:twin-arginine translocase TatA/TatE family subunit, partial [Georgenia subflava]
MVGINGGELVVLLVLAFLLIGPERLPELAQQLGRLTRELKKLATGAKEKVKEELGPDVGDLSVFDPRQYDPRRIVREALMDDDEPQPARPPAARRRPPPRTSPAPRAAASATGAGPVAAAAPG